MCDLKSFSFSHHFGSGFKYFSATIIRKLSKMLNLRLSGGLIYKYTYNIQVFRKGLRGRICKKVPKCLLYVCILVHFSLELVPRFKSGKGGGWSPSSIEWWSGCGCDVCCFPYGVLRLRQWEWLGVELVFSFWFWSTVLIIKRVRESTLSVGKSRARNPTHHPE